MAKQLAQITDVDALDAHDGTVARLPITIPRGWEGATVEVTTPRLLSCELCSGGGCDRCERSGALRAPDDEVDRQLRLTLPSRVEDGALIRLPAPFGDPSIEQLIVEVRVGAASSKGLRRVAMPQQATLVARSEHGLPPAMMIAVVMVFVVVVGVLITLR